MLENLIEATPGGNILENNIQTIRRFDEAKILHNIAMLKSSMFILSSYMFEPMTHIKVFKEINFRLMRC